MSFDESIQLYTTTIIKIWNSSITQKFSSVPLQTILLTNPRQLLIFVLSSVSCLPQNVIKTESLSNQAFQIWLLSFCIVHFNTGLLVLLHASVICPFYAEKHSTVMNTLEFLSLPTEEHLGYLHFRQIWIKL